MRRKFLLPLALLLALPAHAHIGSPDTFVQATAGPCKFLIAAHPPATYPGALELDLRFNPDDHITIATAALDSTPPTPIRIFDAGTATTTIWLPTPAAHTIHIQVQGSTYDLTLPSSTPTSPPATHSWWQSTLLVLSIALIAGAVVLGARKRKYLGYAGLMSTAALMLYLIPAHFNHAPPQTTLTANLTPNGSLDFTLTNPSENFSDLLPDHGKLMHLFLIRQPNDDVFLHLHPHQLSPGHFTAPLPAMPPGTYQIFADFYHSPTGNIKDARSETATETLTLPAQFHPASAPDPDDTTAVLPPANGITTSPNSTALTSIQHDNYTLTLTAPAPIHSMQANLFAVTLLDPTGHPPADMALYLGMPAHAVILRSDNGVFAHIHPGGRLPMLSSTTTMNMPMDMPMPAVSNTATIPYGFPTTGRYRLFIQMKHGPIVETAAFDLTVQ